MSKESKRRFTADELRAMREERGLSQREFWKNVGCSLAQGNSYETARTALPETTRRLVYLFYVMGIPTDVDSEEFKQFEKRMGEFNPAQMNAARVMLEQGMQIFRNAIVELEK